MIGDLEVQEKQYAPGESDDCSRCFFWNGTRSGCSLGQDNCYTRHTSTPTPHIKEAFEELYRTMNGMSLQETDHILDPVCTLCSTHE